MSLYRVGKVWYVDLGTARGRVRRSAGTTDKRQAEAYHQRLRNELWEQDKLGKQPPVTWGEAVRKWVEVKNPGLPDRYRIRSCGVDAQSPLPVSLSTTSLAKLQPATINRLFSLVTLIHRLSGVEPPKWERKKAPPGRTRYLNKAEWQRLRTALTQESPLLEQAARFTLATGLRENNVLNLEWSQVDMKRRMAVLHADQVKNRTTLGIPLNNAAMSVLRERRGKNKRWVFAHPESGKPLYKASNRAWYEALRGAKLVGFRWHDLRHTWASWAVQNGVSLRELMELGGWKSYQMVIRYSHLAKDHLSEAASKVKPV